MAANARHSHASVEHYTPKPIVEAARYALGAIDLDPASCTLAQETVQAASWYALPANGLELPWEGRVFCNPPTPAALWWAKAMAERKARGCSVVFVGFSVELLQTAQSHDCAHPLDFPCCFPARRVAYDQPIEQAIINLEIKIAKAASNAAHATMARKLQALVNDRDAGVRVVSGDSPPHSSMIVCASDDAGIRTRFRCAFEPFGKVTG